jgi:hypothetical protein
LAERARFDRKLRALEGNDVVEGLVEASPGRPAEHVTQSGDVRRALPEFLEPVVVGLLVFDKSDP